MTPPPRHTDYSGRVTNEPGSDHDTPTPAYGLQPGTPVTMPLRTQLAMIVAIVVFVFGLGGTYFALGSTDKALAAEQQTMKTQIAGAATKQDLEILRLNVQTDLLSAVWHCETGGNGTMQCRPTLTPRSR